QVRAERSARLCSGTGKGIDGTTGVRRENSRGKSGGCASSGSRGGSGPLVGGGEKPHAARMRPPESRTQRRRLLAILAISAAVGLLAAAINTGRIGLFPPHVGSGDMQVAAATTHVFVDTAVPSVIHRGEYPVSALIKRAELLGRVMISRSVVDRIARRAHVPAREIGVGARSSADVPLALSEPGSEQRASEIAGEGLPYRIEVQARPDTPVLEVYTEAPSVAEAAALGRASVAGLEEYLADVADSESLAATDRVRLR